MMLPVGLCDSRPGRGREHPDMQMQGNENRHAIHLCITHITGSFLGVDPLLVIFKRSGENRRIAARIFQIGGGEALHAAIHPKRYPVTPPRQSHQATQSTVLRNERHPEPSDILVQPRRPCTLYSNCDRRRLPCDGNIATNRTSTAVKANVNPKT